MTGESRVGGLVGVNAINFYPSNVTASYATGNVSGNNTVGGLAGANSDSVTASYATGSVSGSTIVGGLVGDNSMPFVDRWDEGGPGAVIASYAIGSVSGESIVEGLAGRNPGRIMSSFQDIDTSGQTIGTGEGNASEDSDKTTAQLQSPTGFNGIYGVWNIDLDNADADFTLETGAGDFWDFGTAEQHPALRADIDGDGVAKWQEFGNQGRDPSSAAPPVSPPDTPMPSPTPVFEFGEHINLNTNSDGLIEIYSLEQLNAVRYDLDGNGVPDVAGAEIYALAFPASATDTCNGAMVMN